MPATHQRAAVCQHYGDVLLRIVRERPGSLAVRPPDPPTCPAVRPTCPAVRPACSRVRRRV
jgi:hypothetical protein